mmetsp:Transcript_24932/g.81632  ORF Transcript_24932/g.81632 Transcript_24932/m.81632 type:complete len:438 (-) Transcript_24932:70-1383(-)
MHGGWSVGAERLVEEPVVRVVVRLFSLLEERDWRRAEDGVVVAIDVDVDGGGGHHRWHDGEDDGVVFHRHDAAEDELRDEEAPEHAVHGEGPEGGVALVRLRKDEHQLVLPYEVHRREVRVREGEHHRGDDGVEAAEEKVEEHHRNGPRKLERFREPELARFLCRERAPDEDREERVPHEPHEGDDLDRRARAGAVHDVREEVVSVERHRVPDPFEQPDRVDGAVVRHHGELLDEDEDDGGAKGDVKDVQPKREVHRFAVERGKGAWARDGVEPDEERRHREQRERQQHPGDVRVDRGHHLHHPVRLRFQTATFDERHNLFDVGDRGDEDDGDQKRDDDKGGEDAHEPQPHAALGVAHEHVVPLEVVRERGALHAPEPRVRVQPPLREDRRHCRAGLEHHNRGGRVRRLRVRLRAPKLLLRRHHSLAPAQQIRGLRR